MGYETKLRKDKTYVSYLESSRTPCHSHIPLPPSTSIKSPSSPSTPPLLLQPVPVLLSSQTVPPLPSPPALPPPSTIHPLPPPMRLRNGQVLEFTTVFKYLGSFFHNDVSKDRELNRRIGLATMTFGKLKSMVFTSKKVSLRVKNNVYSAMVLSVLLHGAAESWALSRN